MMDKDAATIKPYASYISRRHTASKRAYSADDDEVRCTIRTTFDRMRLTTSVDQYHTLKEQFLVTYGATQFAELRACFIEFLGLL
eukprot:jgi/Chlat1/2268/Chrsp17S08729